MLGPATPASDRHRDQPPAPPLLVLQPAHLRFYGIDTDLSTSSQGQRTKRSNAPSNRKDPPAFQSAAVGSATEPEHDADNSTADPSAGTAREPPPSADALTGQRYSPPGRTRTEAGQESAGNPRLDGRTPSWPRRSKQLPLSPPPLSARCQLHPDVMRDLGLRAGEPALVLALARGWVSGGAAELAAAASRSLADAAGGVRRQDRGDRGAYGGFPVVTQGDEKQEAEGRIAAVDVDEAEEELGACRGGVESLGLDTHTGGEQPGHCGRGADAETLQQNQPHEERRPAQPRGQDRHRVAASLSDGVAENLRCFLCTAWTNPHLAPEEAAVDGRVSVPLSPTTTSTAAAAALRRLLDVSQQPPEERTGARERPTDDRLLRPTDTAAPFLDDVVAGFLMSAIDRHVSAPAADSEGGGGGGDGESLISVVPVNALCDGDYGAPNIGGGRAGRGGDAPPVAVRVSARIVAARGRRYGDTPAVGGGHVAAEDGGRAAGAGRGGSWGDGSVRLPPAGGQQAKQQLQLQQQYLPPAYTSLAKRSLRHLVVSNGCEVAVPSCPNRTGTMLEGSSAASTPGINGQRPPNGDSTSSLRIKISGGSGDSHRGGGALAALFGGAVCAVGPESLILVEDGQGTVDGAAGSSGAEAGLRRGKGGAADGGETRREGQRPQEGNHRYKPKTSKLTPTDALVELMLLPMTATSVLPARGDDGLKPLEFSLPRGVLLTGPPGVGKTFAVRSAVESVRDFGSSRKGAGDGLFQVKLTTLNGAEIMSLGQWEACQALREAFSAAENWSKGHDTGGRGPTKDANHHQQRIGKSSGSRCAVIFLDEADALLARRDRDGDKAGGGEGARALAQLLTLMDGFHGTGGSSHVIVVGATNRPGALDPALRRPGRFDQELALAPPDVQGRADILRHHLRGVKVVGGKATIDAVALSCVGFVGADLAALAREAALLAARSQTSPQVHLQGNDQALTAAAATPFEATVGAAHLSAAMEKVGASSLRGHQVTVPRTPWSDIGGMEEAKAKLRQAIEWPVANKAAFDRMGLTPPRGILLFGPPGCSKTTLVRAAATAAGATFVCLSGADVFSPYLGEAEAAVRQAFRIARNAAPALLFFDELDAIVCKRGGVGEKGSANSAESRVLATFLTEMDGVGSLRGDGVVVVGATNRPEAVDRALLRPGRFDQVVYAPLPEGDARRQIFEVHTKKMAVDREGVDFRALASISKGLTGAEIEGVCREAAMSAIREEGFGSAGDARADCVTTATPATDEVSASNGAGTDIRASSGGGGGSSSSSSNNNSSAIETLLEDHAEVSKTRQGGPKTEDKDKNAEGHHDEAGGRGATGNMAQDGENEKESRASKGATVTMRHLLAAASAAAARPGVTREMIKAYDRFAAGL